MKTRFELLTMLAGCPDGATSYALCVVHGFSERTLFDVVHDHLALASTQIVHSSARGHRQAIEVTRVWLTEQGKAALAASNRNRGIRS